MIPIFSGPEQIAGKTLSLGTWSTSRPLSDLQEVSPDASALALAATTASSCFKVAGGSVAAGLTAIIAHNMSNAGAQGRFTSIYRSGSPATFSPRALPSSIAVALTNLTGAVADVQSPDPENPTTAGLNATSDTGNTVAHFAMQTSDCGLLTGAGLQKIILAVRRSVATAGADPSVTIDILLSGVLKVSSSPTTVTNATLQVITFTWDASVLGGSPPAATGVEVRINGTASAVATVEPISVMWVPEFTTSGSVVIRTSGWLTPALPDASVGLEWLYLAYDWGTDYSWDELFFETKTLTSALSLHHAVISPRVAIKDKNSVEVQFNFGDFSMGWEPKLEQQDAADGTRWFTLHRARRVLSAGFQQMGAVSARYCYDFLARYCAGRPVLAYVDPDALGQYMAVVYGIVEPEDLVQSAVPGAYMRTIRIKEL